MTSAAPGAPPAASAELSPEQDRTGAYGARVGLRQLASRMATLCWVELQEAEPRPHQSEHQRRPATALWLLDLR